MTLLYLFVIEIIGKVPGWWLKRDLRKPAVARSPEQAQAAGWGRRQGLERVKVGVGGPPCTPPWKLKPHPPELVVVVVWGIEMAASTALTFQREKLGPR